MISTLARATTPWFAVRTAVAALYIAVIVAGWPPWPFEVHLLMHIVGAAMLIGNALFMAAWLVLADRVGSDDQRRRAAWAVNVGDVWFTVPGVVLLLAHGMAMVTERYGGLTGFLSTSWIAAGSVLLTLTGVVWALRLVPLQLELQRLAQLPGPLDLAAFRTVLRPWYVWGTIATVLPLAASELMRTKPVLW